MYVHACLRACSPAPGAGLGLVLRANLLKRRLTCGIGLWAATVTAAAKVESEGVTPRPMVLLLHTVQNNTLQRSTTCCNLAHRHNLCG